MDPKTQEQLIDELIKEYKGPESFWGKTGIFAQLKINYRPKGCGQVTLTPLNTMITFPCKLSRFFQ